MVEKLCSHFRQRKQILLRRKSSRLSLGLFKGYLMLFLQSKGDSSVKLTTHWNLMMSLETNGAILPISHMFSLYAQGQIHLFTKVESQIVSGFELNTRIRKKLQITLM
jgi:hypothetical protein